MNKKSMNEEPKWCIVFNYTSTIFLLLGIISVIIIPFSDIMKNLVPLFFMMGFLINIIPNIYKRKLFIVYVDIFLFILVIIIRIIL
ncbi:hypothetical protein BUZ22_04590 [Staphylococcus haemolyticus]|nr:hypothetical protein BUZ43_10340 [Staphylococcus haemolyticus]PTK55125.1 hypothetical protein BUZ37_01900 [Staphylococcus haemolyticus]PTK62505.1 hypothetical protein BUZ36_03325 [Staphylococcus haemolyticus]PTK72079.1 hypothetical protein BUZ26_01140 [Staphylococcus haemolyticus]PTK77566.1 hypothetical protein BUZ24_00930 [Staphylococcus haemolyticus]